MEEVLASLPGGAVVLDGGCGAGSFMHSRFPGVAIVSTDLAMPQQGAACLPPTNFVLGDVQALPLRTASVDFVVLNYVLEHVFNAQATVKESSRVLKPGGLLYAALPNSRSFDDRFYRFAGYFAKYALLKFRKKLEHQQCLDFLSLNRLFYGAGFKLISFCECPSAYMWMNDPRIKGLHSPFVRMLTFAKRFLAIDLFRSSNYLTLYQYAGDKGTREVTHVCSSCGLHATSQPDRVPGPWKCPHCGHRNVHG
ncbi:MAG: class I SAM-dependent methyltransferase [Candidatus Eiseniibacteriota bacterium]|nr:MAG: class I SAM-dependent methyltransferase [Candidatus Eisenbacteria bacterium]